MTDDLAVDALDYTTQSFLPAMASISKKDLDALKIVTRENGGVISRSRLAVDGSPATGSAPSLARRSMCCSRYRGERTDLSM